MAASSGGHGLDAAVASLKPGVEAEGEENIEAEVLHLLRGLPQALRPGVATQRMRFSQAHVWLRQVLALRKELQGKATLAGQADELPSAHVALLLTQLQTGLAALGGHVDAIPGADTRALMRSLRQRARVEPVFVDDPAKLPELLANVLQGGDLLVTQGAGNVGGIARELAARIEPTDGKGGAHGR